jgi:hypothetical protein
MPLIASIYLSLLGFSLALRMHIESNAAIAPAADQTGQYLIGQPKVTDQQFQRYHNGLT